MEDPDKDVRVAFSDCIKSILESLDSEEGFIKEVNSYLFFVGFFSTSFTNVLFSCGLALCFKNERSVYTCQNIKK